jgi:hypothetical protein
VSDSDCIQIELVNSTIVSRDSDDVLGLWWYTGRTVDAQFWRRVTETQVDRETYDTRIRLIHYSIEVVDDTEVLVYLVSFVLIANEFRKGGVTDSWRTISGLSKSFISCGIAEKIQPTCQSHVWVYFSELHRCVMGNSASKRMANAEHTEALILTHCSLDICKDLGSHGGPAGEKPRSGGASSTDVG